eukprot:CAMPEP_0180499704 /NCGR_PEP_ID=MMETSP1036_2-20121128/43999_1 /TAXON_ID=632150 /ORGANISM="Azadinium spinosum, Strain 3D9" /LENGTH=33 /DNA_ID= /DNA_START= /DNA_END= /DNA_ORIENTATION=
MFSSFLPPGDMAAWPMMGKDDVLLIGDDVSCQR